jgi:hypothetical protein
MQRESRVLGSTQGAEKPTLRGEGAGKEQRKGKVKQQNLNLVEISLLGLLVDIFLQELFPEKCVTTMLLDDPNSPNNPNNPNPPNKQPPLNSIEIKDFAVNGPRNPSFLPALRICLAVIADNLSLELSRLVSILGIPIIKRLRPTLKN